MSNELHIANQEIFNRAWQAFIVEGRPPSTGAVNNDPSSPPRCQYRAEGGRRCAIGLCIPDEMYDPGMEGHAVPLMAETFGIRFESVLFADEAQSELHDDVIGLLGREEDADALRNIYLDFARYWGLEVPSEW